MVERIHRTLKAALMCSPARWPDALPLVLLGLRNAFKEDLQASPAEMVFGRTLRLPGDFFTSSSPPADPTTFIGQLRTIIRDLAPVPAADHSVHRPFTFKDLRTCSHVFQRIDAVRKPLQPPYTGPHRVVCRISEKVYVIDVNGTERSVSTDTLKPAYLSNTNIAPPKPAAATLVPAPVQTPPQPPAPTPPQAPHSLLPGEDEETLPPPLVTLQDTSPLPTPEASRIRHRPNILRKIVRFRSPPAFGPEEGVAVAFRTRSVLTPLERQRRQEASQLPA
ncbi:uncharacterized protein LOC131671503 [Phymastichus coffea]|uniref:uncharacterized protein LOC131671503 n=1 Tax=Phymastichus coffea TaxID=108790 RepID=UPI00273CE948|nr:uncharacterized protein LOC131671503 [Phymastichus coffea]